MILMLFQSERLPVMVCNHLATRGLDTLGVQHVIQFEFARTSVEWFHRVGRVGRMGQRGGKVTNFVRRPGDIEMARIIARATQDPNEAWDNVLSTKSPRRKRGVKGDSGFVST